MFSRRFFLKQTLLASTTALLYGGWWHRRALFLGQEDSKHAKPRLPVVIATWDNRSATAAAWNILSAGGRALDAVEAGARVAEADPNDTSVGYGGLPDRDGNVTLDACIMDEKGNAGSVTYLQHIKHPVSVARRIMEKTPHVILSGDGALAFALQEGFPKENLLTEEARRQWEAWKIKSEYKPVINRERHDTIGILALDMQGRLSGACSTSGLAFKMRGRVGDSPIIGAGLFVDNEIGAATATGLGELVLKTLGSFLIVEEMRRGKHPQRATELAIRRIAYKYPQQARENQVGFLALDRLGRHGAFSLQPGFNYALYQDGQNRLFEADSLFSR
ncbi:MAG: N(4)-(beta-N-acetylglucosaminyl)-L-asparaginase [Saprospiraceae bacterium]|nr:N(4)-(beta-N-acetylglucosaminyl)-L-asparaginase [Saprospiraceae bacterium]MDW8484777.1 N(4)-(beta-N-acetylglucosaminyl)-L-asparaginase [Saprospiraceae bacterium]